MRRNMRKLASIQVIWDVRPIPNADAIEVVSVMGWKVVVKKGEFKKYDKCVYLEIDSVLPERDEFEFMRTRKFRIRTVKLRGQVSQGLVFPVSILPPETPIDTGRDVTGVLGVTKFNPSIPACLSGEVLSTFPGEIPKTDELRVQSAPEVLDELKGRAYYITVKVDGSSGTFAKTLDGQVHVCSRNLSLKESEGNTFWRLFHRYKIGDILRSTGPLAIQGEVAGPGIQKNPLQLKDHELFVFNIYSAAQGRYYDFCELKHFCQKHGLTMVPVEEEGLYFNYSIDDILEKAKGTYPGGKRREGIVIRPQLDGYSQTLSGRLSFKAINNDYLLKGGD